jgi:hypothetical protein
MAKIVMMHLNGGCLNVVRVEVHHVLILAHRFRVSILLAVIMKIVLNLKFLV